MATFDPQLPETYIRDRQKVGGLFRSTGGDLSRFTAPPEAAIESARRTLLLPAQSTALVFEAKSGGRIVGLRITPASAIAGKNRDLLLRASFDDENPSWICPLGDFFGYAWGEPAMKSLLAGTSGETNYCYFPMPLAEGKNNVMLKLVGKNERSSGLGLDLVSLICVREQ